jgi:hypothetical protein
MEPTFPAFTGPPCDPASFRVAHRHLARSGGLHFGGHGRRRHRSKRFLSGRGKTNGCGRYQRARLYKTGIDVNCRDRSSASAQCIAHQYNQDHEKLDRKPLLGCCRVDHELGRRIRLHRAFLYRSRERIASEWLSGCQAVLDPERLQLLFPDSDAASESIAIGNLPVGSDFQPLLKAGCIVPQVHRIHA